MLRPNCFPYLGIATALAIALPAIASPKFSECADRDDSISMNFSGEAWATTATPRVIIGLDGAAAGNSSEIRQSILQALSKLESGGDWKITRFDKNTDKAGMERVGATAEARLPEKQVHDLAKKAQQLSRPGLQVRVDAIEFSPTRSELETAQKDARAQVFGLVRGELQAIGTVFPEQQWRVGSIVFQGAGMVPRHRAKRAQVAMMVAEAEVSEPLPSGDLVVTTATVVFAAKGACN